MNCLDTYALMEIAKASPSYAGFFDKDFLDDLGNVIVDAKTSVIYKLDCQPSGYVGKPEILKTIFGCFL